MQQQLSRPQGFMIPGASRRILVDVRVDQPGPTGLEVYESVPNVRFPFAKSLYLGAVEHQTSLDALEQSVVVGCGPILGHHQFLGLIAFCGLLVWCGHSVSCYLTVTLNLRRRG